MIACKNCKYSNREGYFFCEDCGFPLEIGARNHAYTRMLEKNTSNLVTTKQRWGTARLIPGVEILLHVVDGHAPLRLNFDAMCLVGRDDSSNTSPPTIDLMPFGAIEKGVSRIHATIERSEDTLTITDLGSSNGTYLNGQRLIANQPRVLRDGDEIKFGKLVTHIYFGA